MSARGPIASARTARLLAGLLILASLLPAAAEPADEATLRRLTLTLITLDMARTACGFHVDQPRLDGLLASADLTREALYGRPITPALQEAVDGLQNRFARNAGAACAEAWRRFGAPGETGLLTR